MENKIQSWNELSLTDLFFAYRKAKADCFYESSVRVAEKFIIFEEALGERLSNLLEELQCGNIADVLLEGIGNPALFPKKVGVSGNSSSDQKMPQSHAFFSDSKRAFLKEKEFGLTPEFRMIGDFSVEVHIISALWINLIGHKFDACLGATAVASRLRRYRHDPLGRESCDYHLEAIGSFEPYFEPYQKWRDSGLKAIEKSLADDQGVVALTLDVSNFYHSIDPQFILHPDFHDYLGVKLESFEIEITKALVDALSAWSVKCASKVKELGCDSHTKGGLPIGLSIVRLISNVLLAFLDREVEREVTPIYYARYVDDIFLVLRDNEGFDNQDDVWHALQLRLPFLERNKQTGSVYLKLPKWSGDTKLFFQQEKQKCFFLKGQSGLDLLDNIASQIREVSSERRLMPLPEHLDQTQSARALTASSTADEVDSLRRADGLTLRRLGWSVLLRSVEILARDLSASDWVNERERFYAFAHDHVIRPDKILEQLDRIPRLFAIAVSLSDWRAALRIWRETISAIYELQSATVSAQMKINGHTCQQTPKEVWDETRNQVLRFFREALLRALPLEASKPEAKAFGKLLVNLDFEERDLFSIALAARETDWARVPYKEHLRHYADRHAPLREMEDVLYARYDHETDLRRFLERSVSPQRREPCSRVRGKLAEVPYLSLVPYLFPTRAYTPEEIALFLPTECVFDEPIEAAHAWANYTRAVRGIWVRSRLADEMAPPLINPTAQGGGGTRPPDSVSPNYDPPKPPKRIVINDSRKGKFPVRVAITSFAISDNTWSLGAAGRPDLSPARYKAIAKIINQALSEDEKPNYLVFPELSIPEHWIRTISSKLREGRISLIAGLDYHHYAGGLIESSAVLVLDDHRLGYPNALQIRQRKSQPAPGEEFNLERSHGYQWNNPATELKPVYIHNDFQFSVLVCSELQNVAYRSHLQGHVDCLFIVSWNKDIETFASLVDSASLDVHAYVALSNNLRYGDSRVRAPMKKSFGRDVCRVRGGVNDQLVVVEIDPSALRAQQSRAKRWPDPADHYKPAPEGFVVGDHRKTTPS